MAATKALRKGLWEKAYNHISRLRMWTLFSHVEDIQELVRTKTKQVALRTYLLTYGTQYTSVTVQSLCEMFQLPEVSVHKIVSKMIIHDSLQRRVGSTERRHHHARHSA